MATYEELLEQNSDEFTVEKAISICRSLLPQSLRKSPWSVLNHGQDPLQTQEQLLAYMCAYGEMHQTKLRVACQNFPFDDLISTVEIVDWGCGQGLASLAMMEILRSRGLDTRVKRITLIDPSSMALARARLNLNTFCKGRTEVVAHQKLLPSKEDQTIDYISPSAHHTIHLFSNILDIESVNILSLARKVASSGVNNIVLCTGTTGPNSWRMDLFSDYFHPVERFSDVSSGLYGYTQEGNHPFSCRAIGFKFNRRHLRWDEINDNPINLNREVLPYHDDYDENDTLLRRVFPYEVVDAYARISQLISPTDKLYIRPDINGDTPDILLVRENVGVAVICVGEDVKEAERRAEHYRRNLIKLHLKDFYDKAIEDSSYWTVFKAVVIDTSLNSNDDDNLSDEDEDSLDPDNPDNRPSWLNALEASSSAMALWATSDTSSAITGSNPNDSGSSAFSSSSSSFSSSSSTYSSSPSSSTGNKSNRNKYIEYFRLEEIGEDFFRRIRMAYPNHRFERRFYDGMLSLLKSGWHNFSEGFETQLTPQQQVLAKSHTGRQKIRGVAGAGKTHVMAYRAVDAHLRTGKKVLILTFNLTLRSYIRYRLGRVAKDFPWDMFTITSYHEFIKSQANNMGMRTILSSYENTDLFQGHHTQRYDSIFIDEVQDYRKEWIEMIQKYFLAPKGEFVVFGDSAQNVYRRELDQDREVYVPGIPGKWNKSLKTGFRFLNGALADLCAKYGRYFMAREGDAIEPIQGMLNLDGCMIKYANIPGDTTIEQLSKWCMTLPQKTGIDLNKTAILAPLYDLLRDLEWDIRQHSEQPIITTFETKEQYDMLYQKYAKPKTTEEGDDAEAVEDPIGETDNRLEMALNDIRKNKKLHFSVDSDALKVSSIFSFKGWEAENIILIIPPDKRALPYSYAPLMTDNYNEVIYTAITRARKNLFIFNMGNPRYHDFFKDAVTQ